MNQYEATPESIARVLLLVDAFSRQGKHDRTLEGRVKLAKLDFLMRYPWHLARLLDERPNTGVAIERALSVMDASPVDSRMMRYRYGPWDPSYYAVLGSLIGRGLVQVVPLAGRNGLGYRTTAKGMVLAGSLRDDESFRELDERAKDLRRHLDLSGSSLMKLLYTLPEISDAGWHEKLS